MLVITRGMAPQFPNGLPFSLSMSEDILLMGGVGARPSMTQEIDENLQAWTMLLQHSTAATHPKNGSSHKLELFFLLGGFRHVQALDHHKDDHVRIIIDHHRALFPHGFQTKNHNGWR